MNMFGVMAPTGPVVITSETHYQCPKCEVLGIGTACWLCGSDFLIPNKWPIFTCPGSGGATR